MDDIDKKILTNYIKQKSLISNLKGKEYEIND